MRFLVLTMLLACAGCQHTDDHVELSHAAPCPGGCEPRSEVAGTRIAAGAHHELYVDNAYRLPPYTVTTTDATVLAVQSACTSDSVSGACVEDPERPHEIVLAAGAPGSARLQFRRHDGVLIDEVELFVDSAASIEVSMPSGGFLEFEPAQWPYLLMQGGTTDMFLLELRDAEDRALVGIGAVHYTAPANVTLRDTSAFEATSSVNPFGEVLRITAPEVGPAPVEARAGDAAFTFDVEVVDASAVAEVRFEYPYSGWFPSSDVMGARAFTADGREVHDPTCDWTFDPPDPPDVSANGNTVRRSADGPTVSVTCTIGEASATTRI